jgi:hypothetical protein
MRTSLNLGLKARLRYTTTELEAIAKSIDRQTLAPHIECLQKAAEAYHWGRSAEDRTFPLSTNRGRRKLLELIIRFCQRKTPPRNLIELSLKALDGWSSQLLGDVDVTDPLKLKGAAERALDRITVYGPNPKRARDQLVGWLACIYLRLTKENPARRVRPLLNEEYGPFLKFVKAALEPFKADQGCEAVIKRVLEKHKNHRQIKA